MTVHRVKQYRSETGKLYITESEVSYHVHIARCDRGMLQKLHEIIGEILENKEDNTHPETGF